MNLSILFVFICIIALIIYKKYRGAQQSPKQTFAFAQKGGGGKRGGGGGGGPKGGGGGRRGGGGHKHGGGKGGPQGGKGGPPGGGGGGPPEGQGGSPSGPSGGGLPVKTIDELNTIFNVIGFKFKGGGNAGPPPPKGPPSNKLPPKGEKLGLPGKVSNGLPPMPGSNNTNIDEILKQMMN